MLYVKFAALESALATNNVERASWVEVALTGDDLDPRMVYNSRIEPMGSTRSFALESNHSLKVGSDLKPGEGAMIETILRENADLFAWTAADY